MRCAVLKSRELIQRVVGGRGRRRQWEHANAQLLSSSFIQPLLFELERITGGWHFIYYNFKVNCILRLGLSDDRSMQIEHGHQHY